MFNFSNLFKVKQIFQKFYRVDRELLLTFCKKKRWDHFQFWYKLNKIASDDKNMYIKNIITKLLGTNIYKAKATVAKAMPYTNDTNKNGLINSLH